MHRCKHRATVMVLSALFIGLAAGAVHAQLKPGLNSKIPCAGVADCTLDIYLPKAYDSATDQRFPTMFLFHHVANGGMYGLEPWAEQQGVVLVASNNALSYKTMTAGQMDVYQDGILKTVESLVRVHPALRFSFARVMGGFPAMRIVEKNANRFAGLTIISSPGNGAKLPRHIAVAFMLSNFEEPHEVDQMKTVIANFAKARLPTRFHDRNPSKANKIDNNDIADTLNWMLWTARITHPGMPAEDRRIAKEQLDELITKFVADLSIQKDLYTRMAECGRMLALPGVMQSPNAKPILKAWLEAGKSLSQRQEELLERHNKLTEVSQDALFSLCEKADQQEVMTTLREMRSKSPIKEEWEAQQMYEKVKVLEGQIDSGRAPIGQVIGGYQTIARRYPQTQAGQRAAGAAQRLTIQAQTGQRSKSG